MLGASGVQFLDRRRFPRHSCTGAVEQEHPVTAVEKLGKGHVVPDSARTAQTRFIARQPIFDREQRVAAYELLFRQTAENICISNDPDLASKCTIDTAVLVGVNVLSNGRMMFVNCTRDTIMNGWVTLFPPEITVLEILETVEPDPDLISACQELRKAGYRIALDDFVDHPHLAPLTELADIIKVDVRLSPPAVQAELARKYANSHTLLAEKVETQEEFGAVAQLGYMLFQGYFFCKPVVVSTRDISGSRATHLLILQAANAPELDFREIEALIKSEPAVYYRLFRYLNSAAFCFRTEIKSIVQALALVGEHGVRKWLTLVCAVLAGEGKPRELVALALVRAKFCELLGRYTGASESALFMLGLFSLMDAILDTSIEVILEQVRLPPEVNEALLGRHSVLRRTFELVLAFEAGDWTTCEQLADKLHVSEDAVNQAHMSAVAWRQGLQLT